MRPRVQRAPGIPCALQWAKRFAKPGRNAPRECGSVFDGCERRRRLAECDQLTPGRSEIGWPVAEKLAKLPPMKANIKNQVPSASDIAARVEALDWMQATADLDAQGCAVLKGLLSPDECF